jgi:hypothetical protein
MKRLLANNPELGAALLMVVLLAAIMAFCAPKG